MPRKKPTYDERSRNVYGHEAQDLRAREELIRRGVSPKYKNLPSADYTTKGNERTLRAGSKVRNAMKLRARDLMDMRD